MFLFEPLKLAPQTSYFASLAILLALAGKGIALLLFELLTPLA